MLAEFDLAFFESQLVKRIPGKAIPQKNAFAGAECESE
jgi:hypothetical protein